MSRSTGEVSHSPAQRKFEWSSDNDCFKYYDAETKSNVNVPLPFRFLILDRLSSVGGFSDSDASGIWSNDVRDLKTQQLVVRTKKGVLCKGLYEDIKGQLASNGGKYAIKLYIAYFEGEELTIGLLTLVGSAMSEFIDATKGKKIFDGAMQVTKSDARKKGKTSYNVPLYEMIEVSKETNDKATELDKIVQSYLTQYLVAQPKDDSPKAENASEPPPTNVPQEVDDSMPF